MTKQRIIRWWIWGLVAVVPGAVLIPASALALASHHPGISDGYGQAMVALIAVGGLFLVAGLAIQLAAWVAAVLNTRQLADPRWFQVLLWGGIAGIAAGALFGLGALILLSVMLAYAVAGPDGLAGQPRSATPAKAAIARWGSRGYVIAGVGLVLALLVANLTYPGRLLHGVLWPSLFLVSLGVTVIAIGILIACAAWWGAIFNAYQLADKTWFRRLLWGGIAAAVTGPLFGLGALILAIVLIAYQRSAPDALAPGMAGTDRQAPLAAAR
jgi:hypothetical protein